LKKGRVSEIWPKKANMTTLVGIISSYTNRIIFISLYEINMHPLCAGMFCTKQLKQREMSVL